MQLSYRGFSYEASPARMPNQQNLRTAKYRGAIYQIVNLKTVKTEPKPELKYRGVTYTPTSG
ncbi:MAG: DUF4278 domain-containing protein [Nostoc sp. CreGUA01]|nr:DUF4278 domain-containing protein [Nostoc sp. CreGUA01]